MFIVVPNLFAAEINKVSLDKDGELYLNNKKYDQLSLFNTLVNQTKKVELTLPSNITVSKIIPIYYLVMHNVKISIDGASFDLPFRKLSEKNIFMVKCEGYKNDGSLKLRTRRRECSLAQLKEELEEVYKNNKDLKINFYLDNTLIVKDLSLMLSACSKYNNGVALYLNNYGMKYKDAVKAFNLPIFEVESAEVESQPNKEVIIPKSELLKLLNKQNSDGSWGTKSKGFISSLAALAFLENGYSFQSPKVGENFKKTVGFLLNSVPESHEDLCFQVFALAKIYRKSGVSLIEENLERSCNKLINQRLPIKKFNDSPRLFYIQTLALKESFDSGIDLNYNEVSEDLKNLNQKKNIIGKACKNVWEINVPEIKTEKQSY